MKKTILYALTLYALNCGKAFSQAPISGIINAYSKVTAISPTAESITASNASAFSIHAEVLIIQMKGATIDQTQSATFGSILNYNESGNYELMKICAIQGNNIFFTKPLLGAYDPSGLVQLVSLPVYNGAIINGNDLSAQSWDGSTGGILALKVKGVLDFGTQNIDVSEIGFRGATALTSGNNCTFINDVTYFSPVSSADSKARKGEGIAAILSQKECGRGSQANGGGGGNNHNAGGGGGANYGTGGRGGERVKASTFSCGSVSGTSSRSLVTGYANDKLFLGGGGGSGHGNSTGIVGESGMNGGGLAIIIADTIKGNGQSILANGGSSVNAANEGGGGGGAGGSIVIDVLHISTALSIEAKGGNGASVNNVGTSNCSGPGGGGGGGVVLFKTSSQPIIVTSSASGGISGSIASTSQANCTIGQKNQAGDGQAGGVLFNWSVIDQTIGLPTEQVAEAACLSYTSPSGNYVWTKSGLYSDTVIDQNGCSKVFLVDLKIDSVDTSVKTMSKSLEALSTVGSLQWIDCSNNFSIINGATARLFSPQKNGRYAVIVSSGECTDTSICYDVEFVGIDKISELEHVYLYPNPSNGSINLRFESVQKVLSVELITTQGQTTKSWIFNETRHETLSIGDKKGLFYLKISNEKEQIIRKVIRQ